MCTSDPRPTGSCEGWACLAPKTGKSLLPRPLCLQSNRPDGYKGEVWIIQQLCSRWVVVGFGEGGWLGV